MTVDLHAATELQRGLKPKPALSSGLSVARRHGIRYLFEYQFGAPAEDQLNEDGKGMWPELASIIRDLLLMPLGSSREIEEVFRNVLIAIEEKKVYQPGGRGRKTPLIIDKSTQSLLVLNAKRSGMSIGETVAILNEYQVVQTQTFLLSRGSTIHKR